MVWFATTVGHRPGLPRHAGTVRRRWARGLDGHSVRSERGRGRGRRPRRGDRVGRQQHHARARRGARDRRDRGGLRGRRRLRVPGRVRRRLPGALLAAAGLSLLGAVAGCAAPDPAARTCRDTSRRWIARPTTVRRWRHDRPDGDLPGQGRAGRRERGVRSRRDGRPRRTQDRGGDLLGLPPRRRRDASCTSCDEEGDGGKVQVSEAFQRFTATLLEDRCAATPELHTMTLVGSYAG